MKKILICTNCPLSVVEFNEIINTHFPGCEVQTLRQLDIVLYEKMRSITPQTSKQEQYDLAVEIGMKLIEENFQSACFHSGYELLDFYMTAILSNGQIHKHREEGGFSFVSHDIEHLIQITSMRPVFFNITIVGFVNPKLYHAR